MAKTETIRVRVEAKLKADAEAVLDEVCPDGSTWDLSGLDSRWFGVVPFGPSETPDVGRVWETRRSRRSW